MSRCAAATALLAAALGLATSARADLELHDAWLAEPPPGAMASAAYGSFVNTGDAPVDLIGFASPACERVELHRTSTVGDVVRMQRVPRLRLPAGGTLRLEPGATHLMWLRPERLADGDTATLVVELGDGTRREFSLPVRRR